jgi:divalent metal cation (Fe/Co/Zn/Cd) transporter
MIGAVSGVCFAVLAARAIGVLVITPGHWRASSAVFAAVGAVFSYFSFRAARLGRTDHASFQHGLAGGVIGAFAGVLIAFVAYLLYRNGARAYFAHPLGLHFQQVTLGILMAALMFLGFGAGFALRMPTLHRK